MIDWLDLRLATRDTLSKYYPANDCEHKHLTFVFKCKDAAKGNGAEMVVNVDGDIYKTCFVKSSKQGEIVIRQYNRKTALAIVNALYNVAQKESVYTREQKQRYNYIVNKCNELEEAKKRAAKEYEDFCLSVVRPYMNSTEY